jgi:hypothetical protein
MTKTCIKCQEAKDKTLFYKMKAYRPNDDGFDYLCKVCRNLAVKKTFKNNKVKCSEQDCNKPNYARKLCRMHYDRLTRQEKKVKK